MITTTTALVSLAALSAATTATGAIMSGQAQSDAAKFNAAIAKNNAEAARQQADFDANMIRDKNRRMLAQQRNSMAANGIDADTGSAADVSADSALQGEIQALMALYTGKTSYNSQMAQSALDRMEGQSARNASYINAGNSLLDGALQAGMISKNPNFK